MRLLFRTAFAAALMFTLVMAWLPHPPPVPLHEDDKFWHVIAFVTLSFLAGLAFPAARLARTGMWLSLLGAVIELVQFIPALHRDSEIGDWLADTIAVAATLAIVAGIRRLRAHGHRSEASEP